MASTIDESTQFEIYSGYFVSNKFEPNESTSHLVIHNQADFGQIFGTARVMRDPSNRLKSGTFDTHVVLAAVYRGPKIVTFEVDGASDVGNKVLELRYAASAADATNDGGGTASYACPLIVSVPKSDYSTVRFINNGSVEAEIPFFVKRSAALVGDVLK